MILSTATIKLIAIASSIDLIHGTVAYRLNKLADERKKRSSSVKKLLKRAKRGW